MPQSKPVPHSYCFTCAKASPEKLPLLKRLTWSPKLSFDAVKIKRVQHAKTLNQRYTLNLQLNLMVVYSQGDGGLVQV